MELQVGRVVRSKAGHDKDRFYAIVSVEPAGVWIADGKLRKLGKPKRKNILHIAPTGTVLDLGVVTTDKKLRQALWPFNCAEAAQIQKGGN